MEYSPGALLQNLRMVLFWRSHSLEMEDSSKIKIFIRLALENQILSWDNLQK